LLWWKAGAAMPLRPFFVETGHARVPCLPIGAHTGQVHGVALQDAKARCSVYFLTIGVIARATGFRRTLIRGKRGAGAITWKRTPVTVNPPFFAAAYFHANRLRQSVDRELSGAAATEDLPRGSTGRHGHRPA
jgi:hypothetical protein